VDASRQEDSVGRRGFALGIACVTAFAFGLLTAPATLPGQELDSAPNETVEAPKPAVIPLAKIGGRAESVAAELREIQAELSAAKLEQEVESALPESRSEIDSRTSELEELLSGAFNSPQLESLKAGWTDLRERLAEQEADLSERTGQLDAWLGEVESQQKLWSETRAQARRNAAPPTTLGQIGTTLKTLDSTRGELEKRRNAALALESRVIEQQQSVRGALERIAAAESSLRAAAFERQQEPFWRIPFAEDVQRDIVATPSTLSDTGAAAAVYAKRHRDRLILHALLIAAFLWALRRVRSFRGQPSEAPEAFPGAAGSDAERRAALAHPVSAALLLGISLTRVIHPEIPPELLPVLAVIVLPAWLRVLGALLPAALQRSLYGLAVLFLGLLLHNTLSGLELLARLILTAELALALAWVLWLRRPDRLRHFPMLLGGNLWIRLLDGWLRLSLVVLAVGLGASLLGYRVLSTLLLVLVISGAFLGTAFLAVARIAEALLEAFIDTSWLDPLRTVRAKRQQVLSILRRGVRLTAFAAWAYLLLLNAGLWDPVRDGAAAVLSSPVGYGPVKLSLGALIAFAATLWISWLAARFLSFALDEEVFPRVRMAPGIPFALSTFTRYSVLVIGFITAMAVLGFPLDRVMLLLSALGVGIGFGLQNVVNNFVSGVILLFERPIRIGDRVQLDDLLGTVTQIGIRASHVRTFDGSDVVVPNGEFVSMRLVNWTLADQKRRVILPVGVEYGTDPEQVLGILDEVARAHPDVMADPPPETLFRGFGDSSLDFEMRAWTESERGWLPVLSDLAVATYRALTEAGITIPFPQRDLHLRNVPELRDAVTDAVRGSREREPQDR
jgi:small-conductance mechanosensitive channel